MDRLITDIIELYFFSDAFSSENDFWDPVRIGLTTAQIGTFTTRDKSCDCPICMDKKSHSNKLLCCRNLMCRDCTNKWFEDSVKCPFCMCDMRDIKNMYP